MCFVEYFTIKWFVLISQKILTEHLLPFFYLHFSFRLELYWVCKSFKAVNLNVVFEVQHLSGWLSFLFHLNSIIHYKNLRISTMQLRWNCFMRSFIKRIFGSKNAFVNNQTKMILTRKNVKNRMLVLFKNYFWLQVHSKSIFILLPPPFKIMPAKKKNKNKTIPLKWCASTLITGRKNDLQKLEFSENERLWRIKKSD